MKKAITRFTKQMGLTHWTATHTMQQNFQQTEEESKLSFPWYQRQDIWERSTLHNRHGSNPHLILTPLQQDTQNEGHQDN